MTALNITGTNPLEIMASISNHAGGLIFPSLLFIVWLIIFFRNNNETSRDSAVGATFIVAILGVLFGVAGLMGDRLISISFFAFLATISLIINRPSNQ